MNRSIIVTDIIPAGRDKLFVSGVDCSSRETLRLQPPLRDSVCIEKKITPGSIISFEGESYGTPPFLEDCFCDRILSVSPGKGQVFKQVLGITTKASIAVAFGQAIQESRYIAHPAVPQCSLLTVRVLRNRIKAKVDDRASHPHVMRLVFCDTKEWFNLPITQDFWYRAAQKNRETALHALHVYLSRYESFYLRVALSRKEENRYWLQISGIYGL